MNGNEKLNDNISFFGPLKKESKLFISKKHFFLKIFVWSKFVLVYKCDGQMSIASLYINCHINATEMEVLNLNSMT